MAVHSKMSWRRCAATVTLGAMGLGFVAPQAGPSRTQQWQWKPLGRIHQNLYQNWWGLRIFPWFWLMLMIFDEFLGQVDWAIGHLTGGNAGPDPSYCAAFPSWFSCLKHRSCNITSKWHGFTSRSTGHPQVSALLAFSVKNKTHNHIHHIPPHPPCHVEAARHPAPLWAAWPALPVPPRAPRVRRQMSAHPVPPSSPQGSCRWVLPAAAAAPRSPWCRCGPGVVKKTPASAFLWRRPVWAGTPRVTLGSNYPRWVSEISLVAQLLLLVKSSRWSTSDNQPPESPSAQELRNTDVEKVGGKSASLGEMISQLSDVGVPVPGLSAVKGLDLIYLMDLEGNQPITIRKSRPKKQEILEIYIITKDKWLKHT